MVLVDLILEVHNMHVLHIDSDAVVMRVDPIGLVHCVDCGRVGG